MNKSDFWTKAYWKTFVEQCPMTEREIIEEHIAEMYDEMDLDRPRFHWAQSPHAFSIELTKFSTEFKKTEFVYPHFSKLEDVSFYSTMSLLVNEMLSITKDEGATLDSYKLLIEHIFCASFYQKHCFICENPEIMKLNNEGELHCDGGPAIKFKDGITLWCLNGVRVPQDIAETSARELDPKVLVREQNAEVKREIVRKVGIEKICEAFQAEVLDKKGDYELILLDLGDGRKRPYLRMKNPSVEGVYHVEGVRPRIKTVKEALEYRNQSAEIPKILS